MARPGLRCGAFIAPHTPPEKPAGSEKRSPDLGAFPNEHDKKAV